MRANPAACTTEPSIWPWWPNELMMAPTSCAVTTRLSVTWPVSLSTSTSAICAQMPGSGERSARRVTWACAAGSPSSMSSEASCAAVHAAVSAPSARAASGASCSLMSSAAASTAPPAELVMRLPPDSTSISNVSVLPRTSRTRSNGTPNVSAAMVATTVSPPVPLSGMAVTAVIVPSGLTVRADDASPAPWLRSMMLTPCPISVRPPSRGAVARPSQP